MAAALTAAVLLAVGATPILDRVAMAWRTHPVYVDRATRRLSPIEARRIERLIDEDARGPLVIAVLPPAALREGDGTIEGVVVELSQRVVTTNPPAVYGVVIGDQFRAINRDIPAGDLAAQALQAHRGAGLAAVLADFVRRVGRAREPAVVEPAANGGRSKWWLLVAFGVALAAALAAIEATRRTRRGRASSARRRS